MAVFINALGAVVVLLLLMLVGYFLGQAGWMTKSVKNFLGKYIINVAVPCNCLVGLLNNLDRSMLKEAGIMLLSSVLSVALTLLLGAALAKLLKLPRNRWGVFVTMVGLSNTLFVGLPLSTQLFGDKCLPYVMIYYLANTVFTQSIGVMLVERSGTVKLEKRGVLGFLRQVFSKPPILAVTGSLLLLVLGLRPPEFVMSFAGYISKSVSSLALLYCGFIVYELGLKNLRFERGLPTMLVCRLLISPLICMVMSHAFGIADFPRQVFVIESALPVVSQITVMAGTYGADDQYAAAGATLSTIGCFISIPLLMVIL